MNTPKYLLPFLITCALGGCDPVDEDGLSEAMLLEEASEDADDELAAEEDSAPERVRPEDADATPPVTIDSITDPGDPQAIPCTYCNKQVSWCINFCENYAYQGEIEHCYNGCVSEFISCSATCTGPLPY